MFLQEFKNLDNIQLGTDHQSVQSGAGKVSCNKTALLRCTSIETLQSVRPLSVCANNTVGSFVTGVPAEAKHRATKSLRAWCLADLPGALLQTKLWSPRASTGDPHRHWCGMHRSRPNLNPTATLTASSSNFNPHEAMGSANSQSPLCWQEAAENDARWYAETRLASTWALSSSTPGRSQNGCFVGNASGISPNFADQTAKYDCIIIPVCNISPVAIAAELLAADLALEGATWSCVGVAELARSVSISANDLTTKHATYSESQRAVYKKP